MKKAHETRGEAPAAGPKRDGWLVALIEVLEHILKDERPQQTEALLNALTERLRAAGIEAPRTLNTPYVNTIPADRQPDYPGDRAIERRIKSLIRWNAMAMVVNANRLHTGVGGHISTFASQATLYEVGFNHFFRGPDGERPADLVYFQGHASPGNYARAFLEGRLDAPRPRAFSPGVRRGRRAAELSASVLHARVLAVPHGLDGAFCRQSFLNRFPSARPGVQVEPCRLLQHRIVAHIRDCSLLLFCDHGLQVREALLELWAAHLVAVHEQAHQLAH
jgi:hypothetical protein